MYWYILDVPSNADYVFTEWNASLLKSASDSHCAMV